MEPYQKLANAIILLAVKDYRRALKRARHYPHDKDAAIMKEECEQFFLSRWFGLLTKLDAEELIRKLQMEVHGNDRKTISEAGKVPGRTDQHQDCAGFVPA